MGGVGRVSYTDMEDIELIIRLAKDEIAPLKKKVEAIEIGMRDRVKAKHRILKKGKGAKVEGYRKQQTISEEACKRNVKDHTDKIACIEARLETDIKALTLKSEGKVADEKAAIKSLNEKLDDLISGYYSNCIADCYDEVEVEETEILYSPTYYSMVEQIKAKEKSIVMYSAMIEAEKKKKADELREEFRVAQGGALLIPAIDHEKVAWDKFIVKKYADKMREADAKYWRIRKNIDDIPADTDEFWAIHLGVNNTDEPPHYWRSSERTTMASIRAEYQRFMNDTDDDSYSSRLVCKHKESITLAEMKAGTWGLTHWKKWYDLPNMDSHNVGFTI